MAVWVVGANSPVAVGQDHVTLALASLPIGLGVAYGIGVTQFG